MLVKKGVLLDLHAVRPRNWVYQGFQAAWWMGSTGWEVM